MQKKRLKTKRDTLKVHANKSAVKQFRHRLDTLNNNDISRSKERERETDNYQSVIIKRTDETFRHADDILTMAIHEGKEQLNRPRLSLFMSSVAAGMLIGFTVLAVSVMATILGDLNGINRVWIAAVYPLGFVLCVLSRTQLFTEHTATAVYPLLDGRAKITSVLKLWLIVIAGNMAGGLFISGLLVLTDDVVSAQQGYVLIAEKVMAYSNMTLFLSAILAGWLMAIGAWTILSTHSTTSQMLCIYVATFIIGLGGFHHSIAGSVEIFVSLFFSDTFSLVLASKTIVVMLLGNTVGGSILVALLNYGHIRALDK